MIRLSRSTASSEVYDLSLSQLFLDTMQVEAFGRKQKLARLA